MSTNPDCTCTTAPAPATHTEICAVNTGLQSDGSPSMPDPVDILLAHLETLEADMRLFSDVSRVPEIRWVDAGHAAGLSQAAVLAVHHLRGEAARDAYVASLTAAHTCPDGEACPPHDEPAPDGLRERYAHALRTTLTRTASGHSIGEEGRTHGAGHNLDIRCALCTGDVEALADALASVHDTELARLRAELSRLQEAGDHHLAAAERERDEVREQLAEARSWARHGYEIGQRSCTWSDYGVAPAWLTEGWPLHSEPPAEETTTEVARADARYWADKDADPTDPHTA